MQLEQPAPARLRPLLDLFLISFAILFLELACIRWFPAHVLFLTFFTNSVMLACFLGMALGCLAARQATNYLAWTPVFLTLALGAGLGVEAGRDRLEYVLDVGHQAAPDVVFFGTEYHTRELRQLAVPMEVLVAAFFVLLALVFVGPGQELGRCLNVVPNRVRGYMINLLGSCAGIGAFTLMSWWELGPPWWFLVALGALAYFMLGRTGTSPLVTFISLALLAASLGLASWTSGGFQRGDQPGIHHWSPYYRVDFVTEPENRLYVNQIVHQEMVSISDPNRSIHAYSLPHLLQRQSGGRAFEDVLVIGAGTGNDVSRALHFGAERLDAVEIDPVILGLGTRHHPDRPYQDPRVTAHLEDGRRFLRRTERQYDLIVYALVDSLVLHSGHSNIRLESYLFTQEAFEEARSRLKPGGVFVIYNYFRQGWILGRLQQTLTSVFGQKPLVLTSPPHLNLVETDQSLPGFAVLVAGDTTGMGRWLHANPLIGVETKQLHAEPRGMAMTVAEIRTAGDLQNATDDWPFLYVRRPMLPDLTLRGMLLLFLLSVGLVLYFQPKLGGSGRALFLPMFFLGAGFMLVETRAIVVSALLLGSTWMVNSAVLLGILLVMVAASLFYLAFRPARRWPYWLGLYAALFAAWYWPSALRDYDSAPWLGILVQVAPIFFSSVLFTSYFADSDPDRALAINIIGAMAGGCLENLSLAIGFQNLLLVAAGLYALAMIPWPGAQRFRVGLQETAST